MEDGSASRRRSWTSPTTSPIPSTTSRTRSPDAHLDLGRLRDPMERSAALYVVRDWYMPHESLDALDAALTRLEAEPSWMSAFDGSMRLAAAPKDMASQLIGRFTAPRSPPPAPSTGPRPVPLRRRRDRAEDPRRDRS